MTGGRTVWRAKDAAWWRREWIVALGEEFGPAGPAVIDWLECEAKAQNDGGWVKTGQRSVARGVFVDLVTVGHVLSRSVTLGLLEEFEDDNGRFICRISGWQADQERALAATRKAASRANNPDKHGGSASTVTVGHGESRSVTECPPTGQDRTGETTSAKAEVVGRKRESRRVDQSEPPADLPPELAAKLPSVLAILERAWDVRGGVQPQSRGVGLAMMRNPRADHADVARRLEHWLVSGNGQRAKCRDIASRFGDWVADSPATATDSPVVPIGTYRRPEALERADGWKKYYQQETA